MLPFVFAEALSKLKYTIFSWEWNCIFKCSRGLIKQSGRNTIDCLYTFEDLGTITPFPNRVTWNRDWRGNACPQEVVRFLCSLPSCPMQLHPIVPAVNLVFSHASVHLWDDLSMKRFDLLLFWALVLQKYIWLPRSSMVIEAFVGFKESRVAYRLMLERAAQKLEFV